MKKKTVALARNILLLFLCILFLTPAARADFGPKPALTITVVNAPAGELYLDLLTEGEPLEQPHFTPEEPGEYDPAILACLRLMEGDGWVLAYTTGIQSPPIFGDLRAREDGTWRFSYVGLPETFRLALATADRARATTQPYTRSFIDSIVYDWETNTVRAVTPPPVKFAVQLLATLAPTLLVEGALLWLFKFREKRTWLIFLAVNIATQVGLHLFCGSTLLLAGSHILLYILFLLGPELVIWTVEALLYAALFRERTVKQRIGYALCANIASFLLSYIPVFFWTAATVMG